MSKYNRSNFIKKLRTEVLDEFRHRVPVLIDLDFGFISLDKQLHFADQLECICGYLTNNKIDFIENAERIIIKNSNFRDREILPTDEFLGGLK